MEKKGNNNNIPEERTLFLYMNIVSRESGLFNKQHSCILLNNKESTYNLMLKNIVKRWISGEEWAYSHDVANTISTRLFPCSREKGRRRSNIVSVNH